MIVFCDGCHGCVEPCGRTIKEESSATGGENPYEVGYYDALNKKAPAKEDDREYMKGFRQGLACLAELARNTLNSFDLNHPDCE